jgi:lysophospholipase L1-like esterase
MITITKVGSLVKIDGIEGHDNVYESISNFQGARMSADGTQLALQIGEVNIDYKPLANFTIGGTVPTNAATVQTALATVFPSAAPATALPTEYPATYAAMQTSITADPTTKRDFFVTADETNGGNKSQYFLDTDTYFIKRRLRVVYANFTDLFQRASLGSNYTTSSGTVTLDGTKLLINGAGAGANAALRILRNDYPIVSDNWTQVIEFSPTDISGGNYGIGVGMGAGSSQLSMVWYFSSTASIKGKFEVYNGSTSISQQTTSNFTGTPTIGHRYRLTVTMRHGVISATVLDLTDNVSTGSWSYTIAPDASYWGYNTSNPAIWSYTNYPPMYLYSWQYKDNNLVAPKTAFLGDSITWGQKLTQFSDRFGNIIFNQDYNRFSLFGGPGDNSTNVLSRIGEIYSVAPDYCVMMIGSNDSNTTTYSNNMTSIISGLQGKGIVPIVCKIIPRVDKSVATYNTALDTVCSNLGLKAVDTYTPMSGGGTNGIDATLLAADQIHPNAAGHIKLADTIRPHLL